MAAFELIGGVPVEILNDLMKTAVIGEDDAGHIVYDRSLLALAQHNGFLPRPAGPTGRRIGSSGRSVVSRGLLPWAFLRRHGARQFPARVPAEDLIA